ncbi:MAG TPA: phosphatase PAP2 family protein [Gammaproteobacteria bacterium]|nr:phosphatase PAP2 family protein [Gammaproteobacteria bacterium]
MANRLLLSAILFARTIEAVNRSNPRFNRLWIRPGFWGVPLIALIGMAVIQVADLNLPLFLWFNGLSRYTGELLWSHLTLLGDGVVALVLVLPFVGRRPDIVRAMMIAALLAMIWALGLKPLVGAMRPAALLPADALTVIGPVLKQHSFPSGHTTTIFTLAGVLFLHSKSWGVRLALLSMAVLVGCSRMVVGAHWPVDVLAGAFGGWLAAGFGTLLAPHWKTGLRPTAQRSFALLLTILAVWLLMYHRTGDLDVTVFQRAIAVSSLVLALPGLWRLKREQQYP